MDRTDRSSQPTPSPDAVIRRADDLAPRGWDDPVRGTAVDSLADVQYDWL